MDDWIQIVLGCAPRRSSSFDLDLLDEYHFRRSPKIHVSNRRELMQTDKIEFLLGYYVLVARANKDLNLLKARVLILAIIVRFLFLDFKCMRLFFY